MRLDYDIVKKMNSRIIYGSVTGYGSEGPWKDKPGQDLLVQAISGMPWLNGSGNQPPVPFGYPCVICSQELIWCRASWLLL